MKQLLTIFFLFNLVAIEAQTTENRAVEVTDKIYNLDNYWKLRDVAKFETDGYPSFLRIKDSVVTLYSRSRDKRFTYESPILKYESETNDSTEILRFYGERNYLTPSRPSFEITIENNEDVLVHLYQTLGGYDGFFKGHVANDDEVEKLLNYLESN